MTTAALATPTGVRWRIASLLFAIAVLTFLDRMNMAVTARYIQSEFRLDNSQLGLILSSWVLGYALFQLPGGILGDRFGPRRLLAFAIAWWSIFTVLTALAPEAARLPYISLVGAFGITRFLVGAGEAASFPNCNRVVGMWMAPSERSLGNSLFLAGIGVGGALSQPVIAFLMVRLGWRWPFVLCGLLGLPVVLVWWWYGRDRPEDHPRVNAAELAVIRAGAKPAVALRLGPFLRDRSLWALLVSYFLQGYVIYIFYTWFYLYLVAERGFSAQAGGLWASVPFVAVALTTPLGGMLSDRSVQRFGRTWGRRLPVIGGTLCSGLFLVVGGRVTQSGVAVVLLGLAAGSLNFALSNWWATVNDMSPGDSGTLSGLMNTAGGLGGVVSPVMTPWIAGRFGWIRALDFAAIVVVAAGLHWLLIRAKETDGARIR